MTAIVPTQTIAVSVNVNAADLAQGLAASQSEGLTLRQLEANGGIQNDETEAIIAEFVREWARQFDALEMQRTKITQPMMQAKANVDKLFKPGKDQLVALREMASKLLGDYAVVKANRQREAMAIATEAAATQAMPELTAALNIVNTPTQKTVGVTTKARWVARVTSVEALPMRFQRTIANEEAIAAYVGRFEAHQTPDPVKGLAFELVGGVERVTR